MASRNVPSTSMREDDGDDDDEVISFTRKMKPKPLVNYGDRMPFRGGNFNNKFCEIVCVTKCNFETLMKVYFICVNNLYIINVD